MRFTAYKFRDRAWNQYPVLYLARVVAKNKEIMDVEIFTL